MTPNDKKPIYVAYFIGKSGNKNNYTEPKRIFANVVDNNLLIAEETVSKVRDFDLTLNIPNGMDVQYIDENCVFWVNIAPNDTADNYDFKVNRLGERTVKEITVYCDSVVPNTVKLYYTNNDKDIIEFKLQYSKKTNTAIVHFNTYIPFTEESKIWNRKPASVSDTAGRIVYIDKILNGNSFTLEFEDYNGND